MKKAFFAFLSLIMATPAFANIHINPDSVVEIVKKYVPTDKWNSTLTEYNAQVKASNGRGIAANKLWNVCAAAGWAVKEPGGKAKCQDFVNALVKNATVKFYEVCGKDKGKSGGTEYCIDDFFTNKLYGGTQVGVSEGMLLAKEYVRIKNGDDSLQCNSKPSKRLGGLDAGLKCTSKNKNAYYEFVFDDLDESVDKTHQDDVQRAVCRMYDAAATVAGCVGGGTNVSAGQMTCWGASCAADSAKCAKINASLGKFGYTATYQDGKCAIDFNSVRDASELKTAFGIDNFVFCADGQIQNDASAENILKKFIAQKAGVSESDIRCDAGARTYTGKGCAVNGVTDFKDDIKTCYVKGKQIDFVFDDINENWKKYNKRGLQAMECRVAGGTYSGKRCLGIQDAASCNLLRDANLANCPECKKIYWDDDSKSCVLPDAKSATNLQKGIDVGLWIGGTLVGAVVAIGGSLATAGVATVGTIGVVLLETVGGVIGTVSTVKLQGVADKFLIESNKCRDMMCAIDLVARHLQRLSNMQGDMTPAEIEAIDKEMARLVELIPENSDFYRRILTKGITLDENKADFWQSWESEQIWRAVGVALSMTGLVSGIKNLFTKSALSLTERVLIRRTQGAIKFLSPTEQKFYAAWIDYAPRSQNFDDFVKMFDGDLAKMEDMTKSWKTLSQRQKIFSATESLDMRENYSTFDPELKRFIHEARNDPEFTEWANAIEARKWDAEHNLSPEEYKEFIEMQYIPAWRNWSNSFSAKYQPATANKFPLNSLEELANERAILFEEIVNGDSELQKMSKNWAHLNKQQRLEFGQKVLDKHNEYNMTKRVVLRDFSDPSANPELVISSGGYWDGNANVYMPVERYSYSRFMDVLSHEGAHAIDDFNPEMGALGYQKQKWGSSIYNNREEFGYYDALTERSSYGVGAAVRENIGKEPKIDMTGTIESGVSLGVGGAYASDNIEVKK